MVADAVITATMMKEGVHRWAARRQAEYEHQHAGARHPPQAQPDSAGTDAQRDRTQHDGCL
jgi:hypothetical protein